ncbi:MAG TPA: RNA methyltransferase [Candidatus Scatavimonas merdigallinarum]|uniref:RNA methyltransferase n=1 Tax=Candidatus Scatavimonas merdigallinarum TaxID=2840914 RepID=A0A9D0ZFR5_9FIRM|nr:RNA methyltransferase [Candidatus Scatavimonas merdigallinarum]
MQILLQSRDNPRLKEIQKLLKSAKYRAQTSAFVIEGARLCEDAFISGVQIKSLFATADFQSRFPALFQNIQTVADETCLLTDGLLKTVSDTKTPQGILCVCKMPQAQRLALCRGSYIALETLQDPSNMGTVFRTAEALGINGALLSADCCDVYSPKVIRGSMGAVFRLPIMTVQDFPAYINALRQKGAVVLGAVPDRSVKNITRISFLEKKPYILLIGNEGAGLTQRALSCCSDLVTIPMPGKAESLNAAVAASILMWEMVRGRRSAQ